jgi:hypothetical protein
MTQGCGPTTTYGGNGRVEALVDPAAGISIVDQSANNSTTKIIGQAVQLIAVPSPSGAPLTNVSWSIPSPVVANYQPTSAIATIAPLSQPSSNPVNFFWTGPFTNSNVTVTAKIYGVPVTATVPYSVLAPTAVSLNAQTNPIVWSETSSSVALGLGNLTGSSTGTPPGITFTFSATAPSNGDGNLEVAQLIDRCNSLVTSTGTTEYGLSTQSQYWDDTSFPYGYTGDPPIVVDISNPWTAVDEPTVSENGSSSGLKSYSNYDRFHTYLIYQSTSPGSIWVSLGYLSWSWKATVTNNSGTWSLTTNVLPSPVPTYVFGLPQWTQVYAPAAGGKYATTPTCS